jgi:DNA-binding beta-propeller fold protein YncE
MRTHKRLLGAVAAAGFLCVSLAVWNEYHSKKDSVVHAQASNWATPTSERMGIQLIESRDASGPDAYPIQSGELLFFTNAGTSYGAKNPTNSVVVINARTKKPIAISELSSQYTDKYGSHGIGLSADAKYIYLPSLANIGASAPPGKAPNSTLILDARSLKLHQVIVSGGPSHHVKLFRDSNGKSRVLVEDWNWISTAMNGKGIYELDPSDDNRVVNGLLPGDVHGNMYSTFSTPDGKYFYASVPPPGRADLMSSVDGWVSKIDIATWKVVQNIPMKKYPLWTVFSKDGKWAWVTQSADETVVKLQRGVAPGERDKVVSEVRVGPGPYGMRLTLADKGELGPKDGSTITIIGTADNRVHETVKTDCIRNDHIILSPDGSEMWATCNSSYEIVVLDAKTHAIKTRIPMPNMGDSHGGVFVAYSREAGGVKGEVVSDQNGLQGSALDAYLKGTPWVAPSAQ